MFKGRAKEVPRHRGLSALDEVDDRIVVGHVKIGTRVHRVGDLGLQVGKTRKCVEQQLESQVVGSTHDGTSDVDVAMSKADGIGLGTGGLGGVADGL